MSVQAMTWALEQQVVTDAAMRHVLLCLANYANEAGKGAFPSIATLSSDTGLSERTVQYKLRSLEEAGVIRRGNQAIAAAYISHRDRLPMVYDLSMERGAPVAPGADDNVTGCKPRRNGVQLKTQRGATVAPDPSLGSSEGGEGLAEDRPCSAPCDHGGASEALPTT